ncbi:hypothetical protein F4677DRAFT_463540 [Hypoxylon crocopeplum]|nr:hypothetical protein F4677DRAFT_463540 [Hypoxylon crocopeplum]
MAGVASFPEIPLISLVKSTAEEVLQALSTVGFIHLELEGTGLAQVDIDRAFQLSALIHSMPVGERAGSMHDARGNGYIGMRGSLDERVTKKDLKETYMWGRFDSNLDETETTQVLPPALQDHTQEIVDFDNKCFEASLKILDILSLAFNLPKDFFRSLHKDAGTNGLAFLNYPALSKLPADDDIRAGSHKVANHIALLWTDWGDITLLFQDKNGQPGLQIYLPTEATKRQRGIQLIQGDVDLESGVWITAPIIPNTVLVNVGLVLEGMTDGLCKATVHRVIFPKAATTELPKNRKTIAYFCTPSHDIVMNTVKPGGIFVEKPGAPTVGTFFRERQKLTGTNYTKS